MGAYSKEKDTVPEDKEVEPSPNSKNKTMETSLSKGQKNTLKKAALIFAIIVILTSLPETIYKILAGIVFILLIFIVLGFIITFKSHVDSDNDSEDKNDTPDGI